LLGTSVCSAAGSALGRSGRCARVRVCAAAVLEADADAACPSTTRSPATPISARSSVHEVTLGRSLAFSGGRSAQLGQAASGRRLTSLSTVRPGVSRSRLDASGGGDLLVGGRRDEGSRPESPAANVPSVSACARWPPPTSIPKGDRATANPTVWLRLPTAESLGLLEADAVPWRDLRCVNPEGFQNSDSRLGMRRFRGNRSVELGNVDGLDARRVSVGLEEIELRQLSTWRRDSVRCSPLQTVVRSKLAKIKAF
jgi:hypothetical protein